MPFYPFSPHALLAQAIWLERGAWLEIVAFLARTKHKAQDFQGIIMENSLPENPESHMFFAAFGGLRGLRRPG